MIRRILAHLILIVGLASPAAAQERVAVGTSRLVDNGALFLADSQGYFKAEGLEVAMTAYASAPEVAQALAAGATDFGLAAFTATAFALAGSGAIRAIAAQVREKRGYEGNEVVASNAAYNHGLRKFEDLAGRSVGISSLGSDIHYQLAQIARIKHFSLAGIALKPLQSLDAVTEAVATNKIDAAILPAQNARDLLVTNRGKLIGWYSDLDEQQLGALFASAKAIQTHRSMVEKFVRAYRRGAADYTTALMRHDSSGKRVSNTKSVEVSTTIARYVYPGQRLKKAAETVEAGAYFMDADARLDPFDIARQVEWYKAQGLVDKSVDARAVLDLSFLR